MRSQNATVGRLGVYFGFGSRTVHLLCHLDLRCTLSRQQTKVKNKISSRINKSRFTKKNTRIKKIHIIFFALSSVSFTTNLRID